MSGMSGMELLCVSESVMTVLSQVDDPEYPGVSIVDLGLVEAVRTDEDSHVEVDLIPTFLGCPALGFIIADVRAALARADFPGATVRFVDHPVWTPDRITDAGRRRLATDFTVAVRLGRSAPSCPRCGTSALVDTAMFGSMRCRSISECRACGERLETIR